MAFVYYSECSLIDTIVYLLFKVSFINVVLPKFRAFLIAKLFYAYAVFASFMLQFYVPMDFLEPLVTKAINWCKEKLYLIYRLPNHHQIVNTVVLLIFRTLIVLLIGVFYY